MTRQQFLDDRTRCLKHQVQDWLAVREFLLNATNRDRPEFHFYRHRKDADVESDVRLWLDQFQASDLAVHDLLVLRRFALRRYAFDLANDIGRRLPPDERTAAWLGKDFILLRTGLAMLIGYGVLLGAGPALDWTYQMSQHWTAWLILLGLLVSSFFLVYLNVRDSVGQSPGTGLRATRVWFRTLGWLALFVVSTRLLSIPAHAHFEWLHAFMCGALAAVLAILGQFFFQRGTSMADPL